MPLVLRLNEGLGGSAFVATPEVAAKFTHQRCSSQSAGKGMSRLTVG